MAINRWSQNIRAGSRVVVTPARGPTYTGTVRRLQPWDAFSRAYGRRAVLDTGCIVGIDDCKLINGKTL